MKSPLCLLWLRIDRRVNAHRVVNIDIRCESAQHAFATVDSHRLAHCLVSSEFLDRIREGGGVLWSRE